AHYNFGRGKNNAVEFLYDGDGIPLLYQTRENNMSNLSGLSMNLGLSYKKMINKDLELVTGFTYTPESKITSENNRSFSTISVASDVESVFNTIDFDLDGIGLKQTDLILPSRFSIGAGVGKPRKWFAGLELASQKTSRFSN